MVRKKPQTIIYRRKREGKTNYKKRLRLVMSKKLRLVVRLTNQKVLAQLVEFTPKGDKILVGVDSFSLKKEGWKYSCKNIPASYLTGLMIGKKALNKGHNEAILDTGLKSPLQKGKIYAFLKGVLDAGLKVPHGEDVEFPNEDRLNGKHIQDYANTLKQNQEAYKQRFSEYLKNKVLPEDMPKIFDEIKQKLIK